MTTKALAFLLAATLAPASVFAQTVEGPFSSTTAIANFWNGPSAPNVNALIYVNGDFFMDHYGFNPWWVQHYFLCYSPAVYKEHCGSMRDGDQKLANIVALFSAGAEITLNGELYRAGAPGNEKYADILICPTDDASSHYYKVGYYSNGFGPPFAGNCY